MRKPTAKMIEALVDLFEQNGGGVDGHRINTGTLCGLLDRGLVRGGQTYAHPVYLTDAGLAFLVDTRRAVVASDGSYICGNREPLTEDQVTAELIRFESDRALEAAALAKADAIRARRTSAKTVELARGYGALPETVAALEAEERCDAPEHDAAACDTCRAEASERAHTGLIDATAMMLTEGRGSAITNFPNGSHAWTPVDREGEFDQAARRAPEAAWEKPSTTADSLAAATNRVIEGVRAVRAGRLADAAGALFPNAATPAKLAALGNETPDRVDAYIARAFSTGPDAVPFTGGQRATYDAAISDTQAARELISGGPNATLTVQRLRRGLALTQADRTALAGLLDTVRRSVVDLDRTAGDSGMHARRKGLEFDRIERIYRAHFGDPR